MTINKRDLSKLAVAIIAGLAFAYGHPVAGCIITVLLIFNLD